MTRSCVLLYRVAAIISRSRDGRQCIAMCRSRKGMLPADNHGKERATGCDDRELARCRPFWRGRRVFLRRRNRKKGSARKNDCESAKRVPKDARGERPRLKPMQDEPNRIYSRSWTRASCRARSPATASRVARRCLWSARRIHGKHMTLVPRRNPSERPSPLR